MLRYSGYRGFEPIALLLQQIMAELGPYPEQTNDPDPNRQRVHRQWHGADAVGPTRHSAEYA